MRLLIQYWRRVATVGSMLGEDHRRNEIGSAGWIIEICEHVVICIDIKWYFGHIGGFVSPNGLRRWRHCCRQFGDQRCTVGIPVPGVHCKGTLEHWLQRWLKLRHRRGESIVALKSGGRYRGGVNQKTTTQQQKRQRCQRELIRSRCRRFSRQISGAQNDQRSRSSARSRSTSCERTTDRRPKSNKLQSPSDLPTMICVGATERWSSPAACPRSSASAKGVSS